MPVAFAKPGPLPGISQIPRRAYLLLLHAHTGEEIARLIANVASHVYHSACSWPQNNFTNPPQPRGNLQRVPMVVELTADGSAVLADGQVGCSCHLLLNYSFSHLIIFQLFKYLTRGGSAVLANGQVGCLVLFRYMLLLSIICDTTIDGSAVLAIGQVGRDTSSS